MGLFGALFAGVAGLGSQSNKIGIVSNNISNVNTVGYKQGSAAFNTLVVPGSSSGTFSPGGVLGNNRQLVSQQGLIQATTSATDIAISGNGLLAVNTKADQTGELMYTRSGSFTPDASGNFRNQAGFYLQGIRVTDGAAASPNAGDLVTVNVNPNATGTSVSTSKVTLSANFNANQAALPGAGEKTAFSGVNAFNNSSQILVPTTGSTGNGLVRGDSFTVNTVSTSSNNSFSYTYGGFNISRDITSSTILGDGGYALTTNTVAGGVTVNPANSTNATISNITVSSSTPFATASGALSPGTLSFGGATITVTAGQTLATIASNLQTALQARTNDNGSTVVVGNSANPFTLNVVDKLDTGTGFGGTALAANTPAYTVGSVGGTTTTDQSITGFASATASATENGGFQAGQVLTFGTGVGTTATITITAGQSLNSIAAALQTAMRDPNRTGDTTSTVVVSGTGPYSLDVIDTLDTGTGFGGAALTGNTPLFTTGSASQVSAATSTVSALTGINIADSDETVAIGTGLFAAGTFTIGGATVTVASTDTLDLIRGKIETQLRARAGSPADTTSTAVITGAPGNYNITVTDTRHTGTGFGSLPSSIAFTTTTATNVPSLSQMTMTLSGSSAAVDIRKYTVGQNVFINGLTGTLGGTATAAAVNGQSLKVVAVDVATNTLTLALPTGISGATGTAMGGTNISLTNRTSTFTGNMLDASNDSDVFLTNGTAGFSTSANYFTATVNGASYTFRYAATPNTATGQFNSLSTLVSAINGSTDGNLVARLENHQLYISAKDANQSVSFANGDADGAGTGSSYLPGINWVQEIGLKNIDAAATGTNRFSTIQSLADAVNRSTPAGVLTATVTNPTGIASVDIHLVDPRSSVSFEDNIGNNGKSVIDALGFVGAAGADIRQNEQVMTNASNGVATGYRTGTFSAVYDPNDASKNMSSGNVTPQFSKDITVYDKLGINHTLTLNVLKLSTNTWAVEITGDVNEVNTTRNDGQVAYGIVNFAGDGSFSNISVGTLLSEVQVQWRSTGGTGGSDSTGITFDVGTSGTTNGFTQFAGSSNVSQAIQNGAPTGQLTGVSIDENGFVTAAFSNGQTQKLYQIPLASLNNYNGMQSVSGNAYKETLASGSVALSYAGANGTGTFAASALEQSNVDLSTQLTDLIVAQQAYGANTRVLTVTSQLLQQLNQIVQ